MKALFLAAAAIAMASSAASASVLVVDFENSNVSAGQYSYAADSAGYSQPSGNSVSVPGVGFSGTSGVQNNAQAWGFPAAPGPGTNAAFLQSYSSSNLGVITIDTGTLVVGQSYTVAFDSVARPGTGADPFTVRYNGLSKTIDPGLSWASSTWSFMAVAGQNLVFSATRIDGDHASGLDNIAITAIPEPSTWALMILGFAGLGFLGYRRRAHSASLPA
jgi:hypothetical protein